MIDLGPAASRTGELISSLGDDSLELPTPCPDMNVGQLVQHVGGVALRLGALARRDSADQAPSAEADFFAAGWRERVAADLVTLADAWRNAEAWEGTVPFHGNDMPAKVVGLIALDEIVMHGWDLAAAVGESYEATDEEVTALVPFVTKSTAPRDGGLFGPIVDVAEDATAFEKLLGQAGRDPKWQA